MKQTITLLSFLFFSAIFCVAQDSKSASYEPDFSGHWVSESVKLYSSTRLFQDGDPNMKIDLVINQSGAELKVKESTAGARGSFSRDLVYFLDGRGESNKGFTSGFVYDSKTILKDKKILIDSAITFSNVNGSLPKTEEWELSADGKKLTIRTKSGGNANTNSSTMGVPKSSVILYEKIFRLAT